MSYVVAFLVGHCVVGPIVNPFLVPVLERWLDRRRR